MYLQYLFMSTYLSFMNLMLKISIDVDRRYPREHSTAPATNIMSGLSMTTFSVIPTGIETVTHLGVKSTNVGQPTKTTLKGNCTFLWKKTVLSRRTFICR